MNKSQKLLLLSLIPVFAAIIFLLYVVIPTFNDFNTTKTKLKDKKAELTLLKEKVKKSEDNKQLADEIQKLTQKLGDFDERIPQNKDLEILLIDLEKFAFESNLTITGLDAKPPVKMELIDPKNIDGKTTRKRSTRGSNKDVDLDPLSVFEIPTDIEVSGYYPDVIKFVEKTEKYRRLISIDGVRAKSHEKEGNKVSSKIDMTINANLYIQKENPIPDEEETDTSEKKADQKEVK